MKINFFPNKDATIYNSTSSLNSGLDQILELNHNVQGSGSNIDVSRILIDFSQNINSISQSISNGQITHPTFSLILYNDESNNIPVDYTLECVPIYGSWNMGNGKRFDVPINKSGVSWKYKDSENSGNQWTTSSYILGTTGSNIQENGGGNWYTESQYRVTQSFSYQTADLNMNVTPIVNAWISGSIDNYGFMIKRINTDEQDLSSKGNIQFFSLDTNTIYVPVLQCSYKDYNINTSSIQENSSDEIVINPKLKRIYREGEIDKVYVKVRDLYPVRNFTTQSNYTITNHLPTSSYYSIRDSITDNIIFDYDTNTQLSVDENGSYFYLNTNSLFVDRYYRVTFKIEKDGGNIVEYFDNNYVFKVSK